MLCVPPINFWNIDSINYYIIHCHICFPPFYNFSTYLVNIHIQLLYRAPIHSPCSCDVFAHIKLPDYSGALWATPDWRLRRTRIFSGYFFTNSNSLPISDQSVRRMINKYCNLAAFDMFYTICLTLVTFISPFTSIIEQLIINW